MNDKKAVWLQLPKLIDSQKLRSEAQRVLTRSRQGKRPPALTSQSSATENEQLAALLSWCQAVCGSYGLTVLNFRTSFADARGLCLLVSIIMLQYFVATVAWPEALVCAKDVATMRALDACSKPVVLQPCNHLFAFGSVQSQIQKLMLPAAAAVKEPACSCLQTVV